MQYKTTKQYGRGEETTFAEFKELNDAQLFIEKVKLPDDAALNVKVIYRIFEGFDLMKEYDPSKMESSSSSSSSTGKSSTVSFNPTPFNTAPRPAGSPQKWVTDKDDEEKNK